MQSITHQTLSFFFSSFCRQMVTITMNHYKCLISCRQLQQAVRCLYAKHHYHQQLPTQEHYLNITRKPSVIFHFYSIRGSRNTIFQWIFQNSWTSTMLLNMTFSSRGKFFAQLKAKIVNQSQLIHFFEQEADKRMVS